MFRVFVKMVKTLKLLSFDNTRDFCDGRRRREINAQRKTSLSLSLSLPALFLARGALCGDFYPLLL